MGKNKLAHFAEMKSFHNLIEAPGSDWLSANHSIKGQWHQSMFNNSNPIVLELGCGKGEYTVGLAKNFPNKNFIGVDIKGARIYTGSKTVEDEGIKNAAFLRTRIDFLNAFFAKDEVSEIWLTFSDPQPRKAKARKRLTSPFFIERYKKILKPEGLIHVKTDSELLYNYTLQEVKHNNYHLLFNTSNLYENSIALMDDETRSVLSIKTHYEQIFLNKGMNIHYLKFNL